MKFTMAATGLLLVGFLATHLAGNFLLLPTIGGQEAFNEYAYKLISLGPILWAAEAGLTRSLRSSYCLRYSHKDD